MYRLTRAQVGGTRGVADSISHGSPLSEKFEKKSEKSEKKSEKSEIKIKKYEKLFLTVRFVYESATPRWYLRTCRQARKPTGS